MLINQENVLLKTLLVIYPNNKKMGIFNEQSFDHPFAKGIQGAPGVGFSLTANGNYDIIKKDSQLLEHLVIIMTLLQRSMSMIILMVHTQQHN